MASKRKSQAYPLVEWLSAVIGLAITAGMFGFLAYEAIAKPDGVPPLMRVVPVAMVAAQGNYVVEVDVSNASQQTAASVQIEGILKEGDAIAETSSATLAYVPGESFRRAGLVFTRDPRNYRLQLRVTGYERP